MQNQLDKEFSALGKTREQFDHLFRGAAKARLVATIFNSSSAPMLSQSIVDNLFYRRTSDRSRRRTQSEYCGSSGAKTEQTTDRVRRATV
jgi:hypothetical protein